MKQIENEYARFMQYLESDAYSAADTMESLLLKKACEALEEVQGESGLTDVVPGYYIEPSRLGNNITYISGYYFDEQENMLSLFLCDFNTNREAPARLLKADCEAQFRRLERFYVDVCRGKYTHIDPGHPIYGLIQILTLNSRSGGKSFHPDSGKLILYLITNKVSDQVPPESKQLSSGAVVEYRIVDFSIINESKKQPIVVDVPKFQCPQCPEGLDFLKVENHVDFYDAFLLAIPAELLVKCYDVFRSRLLEQNVRVYLQRKGKVNRGIHETIAKEPEVFFIYNNGLALTAEAIEFSPDGSRITRLDGLQVVNGGQTMACLHDSWKNKKDVSMISVPAKLTLVPAEVAKVIVPYVSRYSNSQNAVKNTDQHSNERVQRCIEQHSRKIMAPGKIPTYWYYERMRGQYNNAQLHRTPSEIRDFTRKNPKSQLVQPTLLAQAIMTYEMQPYLVARGAQKTYNGVGSVKGFCDYISKLDAINPGYITRPEWYRESIAKVILRKKARECVSTILKAEYSDYASFAAAITAYTVSSLVYLLLSENTRLNLQRIWDYQDIDDRTRDNLKQILYFIMQDISKHPNHSEWMKQSSTWEAMKQSLIESGMVMRTDSSLYEPQKPELMLEMIQVRERRDDENWTRNQNAVMGIRSDSYWEDLSDWLQTSSRGRYLDAQTRNALEKRLRRQKVTDRQGGLLLKCVDWSKRSGWCEPYEPEARVQHEERFKVAVGNPVDFFFTDRSFDVLILDRTCDMQGGSKYLPDLFRQLPSLALEEGVRYGELHPTLGSYEDYTTEDQRHIVFIYVKKTMSSPLYLPIVELCLQQVSQTYQTEKIVISHIGCEGAGEKDLVLKKDVQERIYGELYAQETLIASDAKAPWR